MKPAKPTPDFPLTPHVRGGWSKRHKGHQLYIPIPDPWAALEEFNRRRDLIDKGRDPVRVQRSEEATVGEVALRFSRERLADKAAGKIKLGTYDDYAAAGREMVEELGRDTLVRDLTPDDFTRLYRRWSARLGSHAMARNIQAVRTLWGHAEQNDWIDRRPRFGTSFVKPSTGKRQGKPLSPRDIKKLVEKSAGQIKAMILLGINAAYGAQDCSDLRRDAVDLRRSLIVFPRPKMKDRKGIDRAVILWPETVAAIAGVDAEPKDDPRIFRTETGKDWVRTQVSKNEKVSHIDAVAEEFYLVCDAAKIKRRGFYELRHAFRTIADEIEKPHAAARIMGHRLPGLAQVYVDRVEHGRLKVITDYVRSKVFPSKAAKGRRR